MGTWGTAIKNNDAFADIYNEFYELYNKGKQPEIISKQIFENNQEMLEIEEEKHSFWFALALAQWEIKSLDLKVLQTVENIVNTGADIKIWKDLGADKSDIAKRKVVLDKFLEKIHSERPRAKTRKKPKIKTPVFSTGDCLVFKFKNGNYGGAVILATDTNPETANNLVATTRINQQRKPTTKDFEKSEVLILNFVNWKDKPDVCWYLPDLYEKEYSSIYENIGKIEIDLVYEVNNYLGKGYLFKPSWTGGWTMNENAKKQFDSELSKPKPSKSIAIRQLTNKDKWWKIFQNRKLMGNIKKNLLYLLLANIILLPIIILVANINLPSSNEINQKAYDGIKLSKFHGIVVAKFLDEKNHNHATMRLANKYGEQNIILTRDKSELYNFVQEGDSVSKEFGDLNVQVFRARDLYKFKLDYKIE